MQPLPWYLQELGGVQPGFIERWWYAPVDEDVAALSLSGICEALVVVCAPLNSTDLCA